ncbi:MAG TPA: hypothetical protein VGP50_00105 [Stellaceae bacterium]|jgi:hypothetical protein|nr:hypothetical protein [Stellaceae bacterium]
MNARFLVLAVPVLLFFVAGCAGTPMAIATDSDEQLRNEQTLDLCRAYPMFLDQKGVRAELNRRLAVGDPEWVLIDQHKIYIGMSECALLASWGKPEKTDHDNSLRSGGLLRYVYHGGADLVYVSDAKVTSFQKAN